MINRRDDTLCSTESCELFRWLIQNRFSTERSSPKTLWNLLVQITSVGMSDLTLHPFPDDTAVEIPVAKRNQEDRPSAPLSQESVDWNDPSTPLDPIIEGESGEANREMNLKRKENSTWQVQFLSILSLVNLSKLRR